MEKKDFTQELIDTAKKICTPGKGILAADESPSSIVKKFDTLKLENNA
jgi:fructose-bisphosphate aldolase class I